MTIYGEDNEKETKAARDAIAAAEEALKNHEAAAEGRGKKRARLSPFEPRVSLWLIMPAGSDSEILYAATTKKMAYQAAAALAMRHFMPHYSRWLPLHGHPSGELHKCGIDSDAWAEYVAANREAVNEYLSTLSICRARYNRAAVAAIVRMLCFAAPLGIAGETDEELGYWLAQADAGIAADEDRAERAALEKALKEAEEKLAAKEAASEKPSSPLDKPQKKPHNVGADEKKGGRPAPKRKAAPRRKGATENGKGSNAEDGKEEGR